MSVDGKKGKLYKTRALLERTVRVCYPAESGRVVLRTEQDWNRDIEAVQVARASRANAPVLEDHA
jgi:hypothetical protein